MKLSLIISIFHKAILFNTKYGPFLNYFLVSSSEILEDSKKDKVVAKFMPIKSHKVLLDKAELTVYSIDQYRIELFMIFGFFLLRFIRYIIEKCVFLKWEKVYGTGLYALIKRKKELRKVKHALELAEINKHLQKLEQKAPKPKGKKSEEDKNAEKKEK